MGKYGEAAVIAVNKYIAMSEPCPEAAWNCSVKKVFSRNIEPQNKGCPKGAFLALCSDGVINDIPSGNYSRSEKKGYALKAVSILKENRFLASQPTPIWKKVAGPGKNENHQMDIVCRCGVKVLFVHSITTKFN